jgi:thioredoxin-like negative regulator of GroEL
MTTQSRREKIEAMLSEQPDDTFLRYSLAMELQKEGRHEESLSRFLELMNDNPPYVPAFFMSAKQLLQLQRASDARTALRDGIEQARQQGDTHAASEMAELLTALGQVESGEPRAES